MTGSIPVASNRDDETKVTSGTRAAYLGLHKSRCMIKAGFYFDLLGMV